MSNTTAPPALGQGSALTKARKRDQTRQAPIGNSRSCGSAPSSALDHWPSSCDLGSLSSSLMSCRHFKGQGKELAPPSTTTRHRHRRSPLGQHISNLGILCRIIQDLVDEYRIANVDGIDTNSLLLENVRIDDLGVADIFNLYTSIVEL